MNARDPSAVQPAAVDQASGHGTGAREPEAPRAPPIWVVYRKPSDFPDCYVARLWLGERATYRVLISTELQPIRDELAAHGLTKLRRQPGDDPVIVETWL